MLGINLLENMRTESYPSTDLGIVIFFCDKSPKTLQIISVSGPDRNVIPSLNKILLTNINAKNNESTYAIDTNSSSVIIETPDFHSGHLGSNLSLGHYSLRLEHTKGRRAYLVHQSG